MSCKISGVILAGGAGKRFKGRLKAKAEINGIPIIARILSVIRDIFEEIIIVTNNPDDFIEFTDCIIVRDEIRGAGPLGGIHASMKSSSGDAVFVLAGDMPFLNSSIIIKLIETFRNDVHDAVIPEAEGYIEPLHSVYSLTVARRLEAYLNGGGNKAVREFLKEIDVLYLHIEDPEAARKAFTNINSQSDLDLLDSQDLPPFLRQ